jgi:D-psicose/D-tagatose/L-ribulose 3-epimerase
MMRFGVNTWVWVSPLTDKELEWLVPHIAELGFDWIELPLEQTEALDYQKAARLIQKHKLGVSVCVAISEDRDFIHPDPSVQQNAIAYAKRCIEAAAELGATKVGGPFYSAVGRTWQQTPEEREADMQVLVGHLQQVAKYAASKGVTICVEPLNRFESSFINLTSQVIELVDRVDHPNCKVMLDTFHMNIEEQKLGDAIRLAGKRLAHIHSNENDRGAPGSGHVPWDDVAKALKDIHYDGTLVIESFTSTNKSIARAAAIWRPLAPSQDALAQNGLNFLRALLA